MMQDDIKKASILVIDDEPINLILMEEILKEEGFINAVYCGEATVALTIFEKQKIDLILLDLKMPIMDGFEFMSTIQSMVQAPPPILVLTASADKETQKKVIKANAQGIISKPFKFDDVLSSIGILLEGGKLL